jgi:polygalacturonase
MRRREFLNSSLAALARPAGAAQGWDAVPGILARVRAPQFPNRDFDVMRYGASGDGKTDCRPAFRKAIEACRAAGGGKVVVPAGNFLTNGPIHLESNVNLHVAEGAAILFGLNPADYLPVVLTRWEGTRCYNYSPLIYAWRKQNVAITGRGAIDGRTQQFWQEWKKKQTPDQNALRDMGARKTDLKQRVFGEGHLHCCSHCCWRHWQLLQTVVRPMISLPHHR